MQGYRDYRVTFTHSAPMVITANSRQHAIIKAISKLRNWDGANTRTKKRKCIVSCRLIK